MSNLRSKKNKAKAVKVKQKELDQIIDEKIRIKVNKQEEYRSIALTRCQIGADWKDAESILEEAIVDKKERVELWSISYSMASANWRVEGLKDKYMKAVSQEKYFEQALRNDGLTVKQIEGIKLHRKYITGKEKLLAAEKKMEDKRLKNKVDYFG